MYQRIIHFITGFMAGYLLDIYMPFSIILLILFLLYEFSEWRITHDTLFPEMREFTSGYVAGFITYLIIKAIL